MLNLHHIRRRQAFTLLELLVAIALGTMLLTVTFVAVQAAVRTMSVVNRMALENRLMRAGVQVAFDDADFWTMADDPLDVGNQGLRTAMTAAPVDTREPMAYAPKVAFGQPFTPVKDLPQPDYDQYIGSDVATLTEAQRWQRVRPPTSFRPAAVANHTLAAQPLGDPLLEPDWTYAIDPAAAPSLEAEEQRARLLDQSRGLDPWRPYQANDPRRWHRGLLTEQPTADRRNGRYGLMSNLRSFPVAGFGSDPRWPRLRASKARLERPGDLVPSGPFGPYYGWSASPLLPAALTSAWIAAPSPPAAPPQGTNSGTVAADPITGRLSPPAPAEVVTGTVRQTAWTWQGNQMTWLRDAFGDYGLLEYLPSNTLLQTYGMRLGIDRSVTLTENYRHDFQDAGQAVVPAPVGGGDLAGMPPTYAFDVPAVTPGVWYPAGTRGLSGAVGDRAQGWVNSPDSAGYVWVDEAMDLRLVGTGRFRRPDNSLGHPLPGLMAAYAINSGTWGWSWGQVATNVVGSFTNTSWNWAVPLVPFSAYTGGFVTGRSLNTGVWNQYNWGEDYGQSTRQRFSGQPQRQRVVHRRRWAGATANSSVSQADLENRSLVVQPLMPQRPEQWPAVQVSTSRLMVKARLMNVYRVRWSDPVTGQVAELDFKAFGTSLRGARQQRHRDGGWARFTAGESDPFRSLAPADDNDPTLDSPATYDPADLRHP